MFDADRFPDSNERWRLLHRHAHRIACEVALSEPEGKVLGFAWVSFATARSGFARWAVKAGVGTATKPGCRINSGAATQSMSRNCSYADAYAKVLRNYNVDCAWSSRED